MKKLFLFVFICLIALISPPSCTSLMRHADTNLSDEFISNYEGPENSYVHLKIVYSVNLITGKKTVASFSAGGVCVLSDDGGCFVVTVNHFCEFGQTNQIKLPNLVVEFTAQNIYGSLSESVSVIDQMPESDLCLLRVNGNGFHQVRGITIPSINNRFVELQNYGAPNGHFSGSEFWNLFMYEGRWSGYCTERCAIPDERVQYQNLIVHTIPTTRGQSGSPIFSGNLLFGIQVATNNSIEDFGIASSSESIYLFLERNNIFLETSRIEE